MSRRPCWSATGVVFLLSILGCGPRVYRSETAWHADGSVDRAIYQDWEHTPEAVRCSNAWQQTTAASDPKKLEKQGWTGPISKLPVKKNSEAGPYFAA